MRLPLALDPAPGEAWTSYLTRRASQHSCSLADLGTHLGIRDSRGHWPGLLGVRAESGMVKSLVEPLGLEDQQIRAMHLDRYDQIAFTLDGLADGADLQCIRAVTTRHWIRLSGSSFCPGCLRRDGVWKIRWRLVWSVTCPEHRCVLVGACQMCGHVLGTSNRLRGSAPAHADAPTDTRLCLYPTVTGVCGADLTMSSTARAPQAAIERDLRFDKMFASGRGLVAGTDQTALRSVRAWQSAAGLALHLGIATVANWGGHRGTQPPTDPTMMNQLLEVAAPVVEAPSVAEAAAVLSDWCRQGGVSPDADTFARGMQPAAALRPITDHVLSHAGRAHTRLRRMVDLDGQYRIPVSAWDIGDVPQLAWPCALPTALRISTSAARR